MPGCLGLVWATCTLWCSPWVNLGHWLTLRPTQKTEDINLGTCMREDCKNIDSNNIDCNWNSTLRLLCRQRHIFSVSLAFLSQRFNFVEVHNKYIAPYGFKASMSVFCKDSTKEMSWKWSCHSLNRMPKLVLKRWHLLILLYCYC